MLLQYADFDPEYVRVSLFEIAIYGALGARALRGKTVVSHKEGFRGYREVVTDGDTVSQGRGLLVFQERLFGFGCIAEEHGLRIQCTLNGVQAYITFDPVDGSLAYSRDLPSGSTAMVSLVVDGKVVAAYIADINNGDVFGFGPATTQVRHWRNFGLDGQGEFNLDEYEIVAPDYSRDLAEQSILLRGEREGYSPGIAAIARSTQRGGIFDRYESVADGVSIGSSVLSLVRGHVGALALKGGRKWTPWDDSPVMGLTQEGFAYLKPAYCNTELREFMPVPPQKIAARQHPLVIVHRSHAEEVKAAYAAAVRLHR